MMENGPSLTSPDGSRNRNTPERCPSPRYSKNHRGGDHKVSRRCKGKNRINVRVEVKEEGELSVKADEPCLGKDVPQVISTAGPSNRRNPGYSNDLYSQASSQEESKDPQHYQMEDLFNIKVEVKEEASEAYMKGDRLLKEEEVSPEISTDGHYTRNDWDKPPIISPERDMEDDGAFDSSEENLITPPNVHPVLHNAELSSDPSTSGRSFPDHSPPATHHTPHRGLFKKRTAQMGKSSAQAGAISRKRALASAALSSEEDEDETGRPKKLGGGLRNIRFSHEENCVLVHNVIENWTSLYGAQSQKISFAQKKYLWQTVVSAVNTVSHYGRTVHHCKKRLSDIKRYLRTKLAAHKKYPRGTGGGTPMDLKLTEYEEELLLVVGEEVMTGLEGAHLSTDRVEEGEYIGSPEQLSPAPSLPEEEESRKEELPDTPAVYPDEQNTREVHQLKVGQMPPTWRQNDGSREETIALIPGDCAQRPFTQIVSTNPRESQMTSTPTPPPLPSTNQITTKGTYEESIISTLSSVVSKVERLNAQSRKEINRSHRLLNNIHTDLLLLKEEFKVHREQQAVHSEKMLKLLEESNSLKKIKLQLMQEKIELMRGQCPSTSSTALETPAPSPVKEATLPMEMSKSIPQSNLSPE